MSENISFLFLYNNNCYCVQTYVMVSSTQESVGDYSNLGKGTNTLVISQFSKLSVSRKRSFVYKTQLFGYIKVFCTWHSSIVHGSLLFIGYWWAAGRKPPYRTLRIHHCHRRQSTQICSAQWQSRRTLNWTKAGKSNIINYYTKIVLYHGESLLWFYLWYEQKILWTVWLASHFVE